MDDRVPELVTDLQDQLTAQLLAALPAGTLAPQDAKIIGIKVARFITDNWGGQLIYIPKNQGGQLTQRDLQIWAEFNGNNHADMAKKYNLTVQQIYRILKEVGGRERAKVQGHLFSD